MTNAEAIKAQFQANQFKGLMYDSYRTLTVESAIAFGNVEFDGDAMVVGREWFGSL
jgi:hypothetical protein